MDQFVGKRLVKVEETTFGYGWHYGIKLTFEDGSGVVLEPVEDIQEHRSINETYFGEHVQAEPVEYIRIK